MAKFTKTDKWSEDILFRSAKGHLLAARQIFEIQNPELYRDTLLSAGYLCHLGIELLLKGCWLNKCGYFRNTHGLVSLAKEAKLLKQMGKQHQVVLSHLDTFYNMRYPIEIKEADMTTITTDAAGLPYVPGQIGDMDWEDTIRLLHEVVRIMPQELSDIARPIFSDFDKTLSERKYLKKGENGES